MRGRSAVWAAVAVLAWAAGAAGAVLQPARGARRFTDVAALPVLDPGAKIHYEGSIDRSGYNDDFEWGTYRDEHGDWVLLEADGPGCLYNFVQHRFTSACREPVFKFYFEGERAPRFTITPKEFGTKPPFLAPLSGRLTWEGRSWGGHPADSRARFAVVRAFCPMEFLRGCKVTSSERLTGRYPGGWGHVLYHTYPDARGLSTFSPTNDLSAVAARYRGALSAGADAVAETPGGELLPGARRAVFRAAGRGTVTGVEVTLPRFRLARDGAAGVVTFDETRLTNLWVEVACDGRARVEAPFGTFFGSVLAHLNLVQEPWRAEPEGLDGRLETALLTFDISRDDAFFSNRFPMPFWEAAEIAVVNRGGSPAAVGTVRVKTNSALAYDRSATGYFTAAPYAAPAPGVPRRNVVVGQLVGRGQLAYGVIAATGHSRSSTCEGDVRLFLDALAAPAVQSDGTESWGCWGMGFEYAPRVHPFSFYLTHRFADRRPGNGWSLVRETPVDCCYFEHVLRFELEHGADNLLENRGCYSGQVFAYLR